MINYMKALIIIALWKQKKTQFRVYMLYEKRRSNEEDGEEDLKTQIKMKKH